MKRNPEDKEKNRLLNEEYIAKLAARIRSLRIAKGYTNYEYFAWDHNLNRSQYGRYEKGEDLRYSSLLKIIRAHGMSMEEFFSEGFD